MYGRKGGNEGMHACVGWWAIQKQKKKCPKLQINAACLTPTHIETYLAEQTNNSSNILDTGLRFTGKKECAV